MGSVTKTTSLNSDIGYSFEVSGKYTKQFEQCTMLYHSYWKVKIFWAIYILKKREKKKRINERRIKEKTKDEVRWIMTKNV